MDIFIPDEILKTGGISNTERMVLAIYRYYTFKGSNHYCSLKNEDICKMVWLKNERNLRVIKKHLKDLGYIRTDGGLKVTYIGVNGSTSKEDIKDLHKEQKEDIKDLQGGHCSPQRRTLKTSKEDIKDLHKEQKEDIKDLQGGHCSPQRRTLKTSKEDIKDLQKEKEKNEKRIKEKIKEKMTNFERLVGLLPEEYVTPERIEYIEEKYKDRINKLDMADGAMEGWIVGIKNELNTVFPVEFHIEKKEERSDTIDVI